MKPCGADGASVGRWDTCSCKNNAMSEWRKEGDRIKYYRSNNSTGECDVFEQAWTFPERDYSCALSDLDTIMQSMGFMRPDDGARWAPNECFSGAPPSFPTAEWATYMCNICAALFCMFFAAVQ